MYDGYDIRYLKWGRCAVQMRFGSDILFFEAKSEMAAHERINDILDGYWRGVKAAEAHTAPV